MIEREEMIASLLRGKLLDLMRAKGIPMPFTDALGEVMVKVQSNCESRGDGTVTIEPELDAEMNVATVRAQMEQWREVMIMAEDMVERTCQRIREAADMVNDIDDTIRPMLANEVVEARRAGNTMVNEIHSMMNELRTEILKFEKSEPGMWRFERLCVLCHEIKKLKKEGVFDALRRAGLNKPKQKAKRSKVAKEGKVA